MTGIRTTSTTAETTPDGIAATVSAADEIVLIAGALRLDRADLDARIAALTDRLRRHAVDATHSIGIALRSRLDGVVAILACRAIGAAYVPLDPDFPVARLRTMLEAARPVLVIVDSGTRHLFDAAVAVVDVDAADADASSITTSRDPAAAALAYILFTSGSTGLPKGVAMREAAVDRLIHWHTTHPRLGKPARTLQFAPLGFDVSYQEIFSTRASAGCLVLPDDAERRDPYALLALLERERVERLFLPYVGLQALAEAVAAGAAAATSLRDVVTAGEQLRITPALRALFTALPGCVLHNHYGPTETHVVTAFELGSDVAAWPELPSIGLPLPHVRIRIVDGDGMDVAIGHEGELLLGGECLAAGYVNAPELTRERFIENDGARWYRSGDRVRATASGDLDYLGRFDTQIKIDGFRVEPAEVEVVLGQNADVAEAVVVAATVGGALQLVAHIVPRKLDLDEAVFIDALRRHTLKHLAPYLLPRQFLIHAALPLTSNGKIDRRLLAQSADEQPLIWPEDASLEVQVTLMWQQLLGTQSIAADDNLFDRGARSLTVVRALTHLRRHGHVLSAAQVYDRPTIAGQLAVLGSHDQRDAAVSAAGQRGERQRAALNRFGPRGVGR